MKKPWLAFSIAIASLLVGCSIYFATRSESIFINQWIDQMLEGRILLAFQGLVSNSSIPPWMIYSLPGALWMGAFVLFILMIWDFRLHHRSILWLALAVSVGIGIEVLQGFQMVPGMFDVTDLLLIFLGASIPILFTYLKQRVCASI